MRKILAYLVIIFIAAGSAFFIGLNLNLQNNNNSSNLKASELKNSSNENDKSSESDNDPDNLEQYSGIWSSSDEDGLSIYIDISIDGKVIAVGNWSKTKLGESSTRISSIYLDGSVDGANIKCQYSDSDSNSGNVIISFDKRSMVINDLSSNKVINLKKHPTSILGLQIDESGENLKIETTDNKNTTKQKLNYIKNELNKYSFINNEEYWQKFKQTDFAHRLLAEKSYNTYDNALNEIYLTLKSTLPKEVMDKLSDDEKAWVKTKDAEAFEEHNKGRTDLECELLKYNYLYEATVERCNTLIDNYMD